MTPIVAQAIVDRIRMMPPLWEVTVWGGRSVPLNEDVAEHRRTYTIAKNSDNLAAQEGIRLFVDEIEALSEWN